MIRIGLKKILGGFVGILCVLPSFSQNAKVIIKPHPVFQRDPVEFIKETKYDMIEFNRVIPGDSLIFSLEITDPEGEYYKLYDWGALNVFVKPGSVIVIDYNDRDRTKTRFSGDLAKENAWLNQSWFLEFQMLYPGKITFPIVYKDYRKRVFVNADSLKRVVKGISCSEKFVSDCQRRIDFMVIGTLQNYYRISAQNMQRESTPADFESWNRNFKLAFSKKFLKDAYRICKRHKEQDVLQYRQTSQALMGIVYEIDPEFAKRTGYSLFEEEYTLMQVLNDVTRLYSPELLEIQGKVKDSVVLRVINGQIKEKRNLLTGAEVTDCEFKDMDGNVHKLSDYKGIPMYIDVWATWCNPCKALSPNFHELADEYTGKNIKFIAISLDKKITPWLNYLKQHDHSENVLELHTGKRDFANSYQINGIPRFILIDRDFKIRMAFAYKPIESSMKELKILLDQLSRE